MEIEVQPNDEPIVAHQIEEIDTNRYLVDHDILKSKSDYLNDDDVYMGLENDEYNDVMAKDLKGKAPDGSDKKRRRDLRTGCEAFLRINIGKDRKWFVKEFKNAHNHELTATPTKVMKHRSHGKFHRSMACKSLMSELSHSGLKPCHIKKVVNSMKNPLEPDVTSKQCADVLSEERKQYKGGRSRDAYIKFGDVLVFDVTYMTNKFKFPFSPFVGVNHHGQSILFGGALLENEKEETFEWLFKEFKKCMFDKHPTAIITDQDKAMGNAILKVFPNTRHRYCAWHINKHEREHLQPLKTHCTDFKELHKEWVKSNTVVEFETIWEVLCDKYKFDKNSWIREMYKKRSHWAKVFFKDVFLAGMTTSGRSESIHSFFDGFVNSKTMLNEFIIQYDKAVEARRAAEEDEDFKTMNSMLVLSSVNPIEAKAGASYTRKMFEVFKKEWVQATNNLTHETLSKNSDEIIYRVGQVNIEKNHWRVVTFRLSNKVDITCSCAKFETHGMLCKHALYVLKKRHVETLPDHYILPRWTLNVRHKVGNGFIGLEDVHDKDEVSALALWNVHVNCSKAVEQAKDSLSEIKKFNTLVVKFLEEQGIRKKSKENANAPQDPRAGSSQVDMIPQITIRDPQVPVTTKGRPKEATRIKSSLEAPKKEDVLIAKSWVTIKLLVKKEGYMDFGLTLDGCSTEILS
ncbi:FAR1-related sequence 5-like protein [Tanacetum coccineum]